MGFVLLASCNLTDSGQRVGTLLGLAAWSPSISVVPCSS